jgi:CubicO group peptidase (beta-lactamase class C family)
VVPAGWIEQMTRMVPTGAPMPGYGLFTWQVDDEPGAFSAVGLAGQFIYVHPQTRTVIVKLSYYPPAEPEHVRPETIAFFQAVRTSPRRAEARVGSGEPPAAKRPRLVGSRFSPVLRG